MMVSKRTTGDSEICQFLCENSSSFFDREEWLRVLQEGLEIPVAIYCLERDGKICLALPGVIFNLGIVRMFYSNIPYGGFIGDIQLIRPSLPLFQESVRKDGVHLIRIGKSSHDALPGLEGYRQEIAFTHLLDLAGVNEEQLWKGYKKRVRRDIRKAEKSGISIHDVGDAVEIETLFDIYIETMRRNEAYNVWTKKMLHAIYSHLVHQGKARILLAKLNDKIIAGIILLFSPETVYYFFAASANQYLSFCPNDLLVHHAICLTIRQGRRYFDLMTSQKEDLALMNFKEKWGADRYPFHFYEKSLTPIRPWLWKRVWGVANTSAGARLIRLFRGR